MTFYNGQRAVKGLAPTAAKFNKLSASLDDLTGKTAPKFVHVRRSTNVTLTVTGTAVQSGANIAWDTVISDTNSLFSAGTFSIPAGSKLMRIIGSVKFSSLGNTNVSVGTRSGYIFNDTLSTVIRGLGQSNPQFQIGYASADGVRTCQVDSGWMSIENSAPFTFSNPITVTIAAGTSVTINSDVSTWACVEIL